MKANELMIGDWVLQDGFEYKVVMLRECDILNEYPIAVDSIVHGYTYCPSDAIQPIPLTAEILEKNGLDKVPELSMVLNRDTMPMYHSPMLYHVHELQHALRLCGLNDLADNFKI